MLLFKQVKFVYWVLAALISMLLMQASAMAGFNQVGAYPLKKGVHALAFQPGSENLLAYGLFDGSVGNMTIDGKEKKVYKLHKESYVLVTGVYSNHAKSNHDYDIIRAQAKTKINKFKNNID